MKLATPQERPMLLATIKKVQADLELFALQTENKEAKEMYKKNAVKMTEVLNLVTLYLEN